MFVDEHSEELSVVRADVEQHGWTLERPEAQRHILSSKCHVSIDGGRNGTAVPDQLVRFLEGVADGGCRFEAGWHLWKQRKGQEMEHK